MVCAPRNKAVCVALQLYLPAHQTIVPQQIIALLPSKICQTPAICRVLFPDVRARNVTELFRVDPARRTVMVCAPSNEAVCVALHLYCAPAPLCEQAYFCQCDVLKILVSPSMRLRLKKAFGSIPSGRRVAAV